MACFLFLPVAAAAFACAATAAAFLAFSAFAFSCASHFEIAMAFNFIVTSVNKQLGKHFESSFMSSPFRLGAASQQPTFSLADHDHHLACLPFTDWTSSNHELGCLAISILSARSDAFPVNFIGM